MFEEAVRMKLRFETSQGDLSVEDLWDLPLTSERKANLDDVAKKLSRAVKEADVEESFVLKSTKSATMVQLKFDIVKHIIAVRLAENAAALEKRENRAKKDRILEILAQKQDASLSNKTEEELRELAASL